MTRARIVGTGSYLPERIVPNSEFEASLDTSDAWIRERTGIVERRVAGEHETTCDLAEHAARAALEASDWSAESLDLIVVGTTTPDRIYPSTACRLQALFPGVAKGDQFHSGGRCRTDKGAPASNWSAR